MRCLTWYNPKFADKKRNLDSVPRTALKKGRLTSNFSFFPTCFFVPYSFLVCNIHAQERGEEVRGWEIPTARKSGIGRAKEVYLCRMLLLPLPFLTVSTNSEGTDSRNRPRLCAASGGVSLLCRRRLGPISMSCLIFCSVQHVFLPNVTCSNTIISVEYFSLFFCSVERFPN